MLLIKVYHSMTLATSSPLATLDLTQVLDALLDVPDAQPISNLNARASIHQKVDGKWYISRLIALALQN